MGIRGRLHLNTEQAPHSRRRQFEAVGTEDTDCPGEGRGVNDNKGLTAQAHGSTT